MCGVLFQFQQDDDGDQLLGSFSQLKDVLNNITGKQIDCNFALDLKKNYTAFSVIHILLAAIQTLYVACRFICYNNIFCHSWSWHKYDWWTHVINPLSEEGEEKFLFSSGRVWSCQEQLWS